MFSMILPIISVAGMAHRALPPETENLNKHLSTLGELVAEWDKHASQKVPLDQIPTLLQGYLNKTHGTASHQPKILILKTPKDHVSLKKEVERIEPPVGQCIFAVVIPTPKMCGTLALIYHSTAPLDGKRIHTNMVNLE